MPYAVAIDEPHESPPRTLEELAAEARAADPMGLTCPKCGWTCLPVLYTQRLPNGETNRVRKCRNCGKKYLCRERMLGEVGE